MLQLKIMLPILCCSFLAASCSAGTSRSTASTQSDKEYPQPVLIGTEDYAIYDQLAQDRQGINDATILYLAPGSTSAVLNGQSITLKNEPFWEDEILYLPAQEIMSLMDCAVKLDETSGCIRVYVKSWAGADRDEDWTPTVYWLGSHIMARYSQKTEQGLVTKLEDIGLTGAPILRDGILYLPQDYFSGYGTWLEKREQYRLNLVGYEVGIDNIVPGQPYQDLPEQLRDGLTLVKESEPEFLADNTKIACWLKNTYANADLQVETTRRNPDSESYMKVDPKYRDVEFIRTVKVLSEKYSTPYGIRLGDSVDAVG